MDSNHTAILLSILAYFGVLAFGLVCVYVADRRRKRRDQRATGAGGWTAEASD
jgi:hypothetical protein